MNIAYSCDDNYVWLTGISIISLLENNKDIEDIEIYLVSKNISKDNIYLLDSICHKYKRNLIVVRFDEIAYDLKLSSTGRHIETVYTKIFFGRIKNLDTIFYVDSDTIINGSLKELANIDLSESYMGMVETYTGEKAKLQLGINSKSPFYNDGVALVNVQYCRQHNLIEKSLEVIKDFNGNPPVLSEGVINKVCEGHIKSLPPQYNMMAGLYELIDLNPTYVAEKLNYSIMELKSSKNNPVVIHFLSGFYNRPWNVGCTHPLKEEFNKYKKISPWRDIKLMKKNLPIKFRLLRWLLHTIGPYNFEKIQKYIKKS